METLTITDRREAISMCTMKQMNAPDELFHTSEPFTTQNSEFKAGKGFSAEDLLMEPTPFPNQLLYCSSAGRTDQIFL